MPNISVMFVKVARKPQYTLDQRAFSQDVQTAVDPNLTITRYNRTWRFSQPQLMNGDFLVGKLGFTAPGAATDFYYDEDLKDFREQPLPTREGSYAQWAIDLSSQVMAFETKPPQIRLQSFVGALRRLLDEHDELALTAEFIAESGRFYEWAGRVDRVTSFRAMLRAPNPNWADRPRDIIRDLFEPTNADRATVEVSKEPRSQDGLHIADTMLDALIAYGEEGYSDIIARGLRNGQKRVFDSTRKVASERVDVAARTGVPGIWEELTAALRRFRTRP